MSDTLDSIADALMEFGQVDPYEYQQMKDYIHGNDFGNEFGYGFGFGFGADMTKERCLELLKKSTAEVNRLRRENEKLRRDLQLCMSKLALTKAPARQVPQRRAAPREVQQQLPNQAQQFSIRAKNSNLSFYQVPQSSKDSKVYSLCIGNKQIAEIQFFVSQWDDDQNEYSFIHVEPVSLFDVMLKFVIDHLGFQKTPRLEYYFRSMDPEPDQKTTLGLTFEHLRLQRDAQGIYKNTFRNIDQILVNQGTQLKDSLIGPIDAARSRIKRVMLKKCPGGIKIFP
jgi:hypothetical protein